MATDFVVVDVPEAEDTMVQITPAEHAGEAGSMAHGGGSDEEKGGRAAEEDGAGSALAPESGGGSSQEHGGGSSLEHVGGAAGSEPAPERGGGSSQEHVGGAAGSALAPERGGGAAQEHVGGAAVTQDVKVDGPVKEQGDVTLRARKKWIEERRTMLVLLASLAATAAYTSCNTIPGGTWQEDLPGNPSYPPGDWKRIGHQAGDPIMGEKHPSAYVLYKLSSTTAMMLSLLIMVMLSHDIFYRTTDRMLALQAIALVDLALLGCTFAIGLTPSDPGAGAGLYIFAFMICIGMFISCRLGKFVYKMMKKCICS